LDEVFLRVCLKNRQKPSTVLILRGAQGGNEKSYQVGKKSRLDPKPSATTSPEFVKRKFPRMTLLKPEQHLEHIYIYILFYYY
jgi:hypothetical protein